MLLALFACSGETSKPPPAERVLEGPLVGAGIASDGATLWLTAPGIDGEGGAYRFDAPSGELGLGDAAASVVADHAGAAGAAIAACGDADGDGQGDVLVGAPSENRYGGAWLLRGPVADGPLTGAFLQGVADEGLAELAVAAPDGAGLGSSHDVGSVGLHHADGDGVQRIASFESTWSESHLGFRTGLVLGEDLDGDGIGDLAVGGWGADKVHVVPGPLQGTYDANEAGPMLVGEDGEGTGHALAAGDVDGDGANDLLIGTPLAVGETGGAWVLPGPFGPDSEGLIRNRGTKLRGVEIGDQAGFSVAIPGDADGDGAEDLVIGAPFAGGVGPEAGAAYLVLGPGAEPDLELARALFLGDVAYGRLGWAVGGLQSAEGLLIVASAPEADVGDTIGAGSVVGWRADVLGNQYPDYGVFRVAP
jgi:hypothetical protein